MIEQLIEKTNTTEFDQNGHFHLTELKGLIGRFKTMEFNFIVEERDDYGKISEVDHWRLIAHNFKGFPYRSCLFFYFLFYYWSCRFIRN
ncbi:hypothetical protein [uncultured Psychroserpens sp.]|uniref:hypothetical protein n=1 Tax=uncultured Psychroserpens sp. TaxID=255436 RepID=UPI00261A1534|nr:hypothetical protein [uncultured Psychroserpens sp.]